jgi:hypothetical protein
MVAITMHEQDRRNHRWRRLRPYLQAKERETE